MTTYLTPDEKAELRRLLGILSQHHLQAREAVTNNHPEALFEAMYGVILTATALAHGAQNIMEKAA